MEQKSQTTGSRQQPPKPQIGCAHAAPITLESKLAVAHASDGRVVSGKRFQRKRNRRPPRKVQPRGIAINAAIRCWPASPVVASAITGKAVNASAAGRSKVKETTEAFPGTSSGRAVTLRTAQTNVAVASARSGVEESAQSRRDGSVSTPYNKCPRSLTRSIKASCILSK